LGGGFPRSGVSTDVVEQIIRYKKSFINMEKALVEQIDTIIQSAINQNVTLPEKPEFTLALRDGVACAVETTTNFVLSFWKP